MSITESTFRVYPRVGGETHREAECSVKDHGLSPRGRGNRKCRYERQDDDGSIPAWAGKPGPRRRVRVPVGARDRSIPVWAGKPLRSRPSSTSKGVYPRVGGETHSTPARAPAGTGLSPRGRGNRCPVPQVLEALGSIPAWAGKP